jgi:hypothetical protein
MGTFSLSGGVEVVGFISPTDPLDTYPVIDPLYGIDGLRNVNLISDLNNIPELRRRAGMVVGVSGGTVYYKLNNPPWNYNISDWSVFNSGGGSSVSGDYLPLSGGTVTGGTVFTQGVTANTVSATTYLNLPIDLTITGFSYSNNTFTLTNNSGDTLSTTFNSVTGLTVNGILSATTISGGTLFGDGSNLTGISTQDTFVTGGTYSNGTAVFTNNTGGTFNVVGFYTGETSYVNSIVTGVGLSGSSTTGNITLINTSPDQIVSLNEGNNIDVQGTYPNFTISVTGLTDNNRFVTGFTYNNSNTFTIFDNSGSTYSSTFNVVTGLTATTLSATTYQNLPTDVRVTGVTYNNNTFTFTNNTGGTFNVLFNTVTGLTSTGTILSSTLSATTYQNLPTDVRVTGATYNNNTFTYTNNTGGTFNILFNTVTGLTVNGNLSVTGNTNVRALTGTSAFLSGSAQNVLTVVGSGTTSPIFTVQGSSGELFSINDSLIGSLFSVNNISGLPILEVFDDDTILMGSYVSPSLNTTKRLTLSAGTNTVYSIPTSAYTGMFVDYTLTSSVGVRAGNVMSIWSGSTAEYTDVSTNDIGTTTGVTFSVAISGNNAVITSSATTSNWTLKTIIRGI